MLTYEQFSSFLASNFLIKTYYPATELEGCPLGVATEIGHGFGGYRIKWGPRTKALMKNFGTKRTMLNVLF
jgi:hypothetical protein